MCLYKFGARDSWLNNWEHRGEDMYCPRALLKLPGSGTTFFFPVKDTPAPNGMPRQGVIFTQWTPDKHHRHIVLLSS